MYFVFNYKKMYKIKYLICKNFIVCILDLIIKKNVLKLNVSYA